MKTRPSEPPSSFQSRLSVLNTAVTLSAVKDGSGKSVCGYMSMCVLCYVQFYYNNIHVLLQFREYGTLLLYYRMNIVYVRPLTLFGPLPNIHAQLLRTLFHDKLIYTFSLIASQMCTGTIFYVRNN